MSSFADLGVTRPVVDALTKRGITAPFAVQDLVIGDVLDGSDVLVQSPTGSGKTLAFGVPLAECIEPDDLMPAALILAPTRELALQIEEEIAPLAAARKLRVAAVFGGVGLEKQARDAARAHIIVATPGRLEDLLNRRAFDLGELRILVIDEADRMLDMGFRPAVDRIVNQTPGDRQTLFFSATLEAAAGELARAYTNDPARHVHEPVEADRGEVAHRFVHLDQAGKVEPWSRSSAPPTAAARSSSSVPSTAPTGWSSGSPSTASTPWRCTATRPRTSATGPLPASPPATSTRSSPPMSPPAGSTSMTSPT